MTRCSLNLLVEEGGKKRNEGIDKPNQRNSMFNYKQPEVTAGQKIQRAPPRGVLRVLT